MPQHLSTRKQLLQTTNLGIVAGAVVWILLVVRGAQNVAAGHTNDYSVMFGPFTLMHITKQQAVQGFTASFSLEAGLIGYVIFWISVGVLFGIGFAYYKKSIVPPK